MLLLERAPEPEPELELAESWLKRAGIFRPASSSFPCASASGLRTGVLGPARSESSPAGWGQLVGVSASILAEQKGCMQNLNRVADDRRRQNYG